MLYWDINYCINLIKETILSIKKIYNLSRKQATIIKEYINNILKKDFIRLSILLYTTLVLIVKKLNNNLCIYINYRALKFFIIKNQNTLLLIKEILTCLY